jgi:ubiquinone/menaquinone biosynthesis C-methylase UbiE
MDAHSMTFASATFDCVVAQFVITLVADPERVLSECHRVVKPGGRIILVNHLYSEVGLAAAVERWAAQRTRSLGLRPEFPFARLQAWAHANKDAILIERRKVAPFGIYTLVCFERSRQARAA